MVRCGALTGRLNSAPERKEARTRALDAAYRERMAWNPSTEAELRDGASHYCYEVEQAVGQALFVDRSTITSGFVMNALTEAPLLHLRLLDDFFRFRREASPCDDVTAQHFVAEWTPTPFLDVDERREINAYLTHLAARRTHTKDWKLGPMRNRFADLHDRFIAALVEHKPSRVAWFDHGTSVIAAALGG